MTDSQRSLQRYIRLYATRFPGGQALVNFLDDAGCTIIWVEESELYHGAGRPPWRLHFRLPRELEEEFGFTRELLLLSTNWKEFQVRSLDALHTEVERSTRVDPEVAFIVTRDRDAHDSAREWCDNQFTVVALTAGDLPTGPDAQGHLRKALQGSFFGRNFYDEGGPVTGERFFGRQLLLRSLAVDLRNGRPVGLFGLRRIGKTSVLQQLHQTLDESFVYVYIDAQRSRLSGDARHLLLLLARGLNEQTGGDFLDPELFEHRWADSRPSMSTLVVDRLSEFVAQSRRNFVVAIDEIEVAFPTASDRGLVFWDQVLASLRSIGQSERRFSMILAGASPHIYEVPLAGDRDNPVFQFGSPTYAGCMSQREMESMVVKLGKRTGIRWTSEALDLLYSQTGGHPYLTRRFCSFISDMLEPPATVVGDMVVASAAQFADEGVPIFEQITESLRMHYPDEMALLAVIASTLSYKPPKRGSSELSHLLGYDLVQRDARSDSLSVRMLLLKRWLTGTR